MAVSRPHMCFWCITLLPCGVSSRLLLGGVEQEGHKVSMVERPGLMLRLLKLVVHTLSATVSFRAGCAIPWGRRGRE
eukprot:1525851-Amphidinium_carterae.2